MAMKKKMAKKRAKKSVKKTAKKTFATKTGFKKSRPTGGTGPRKK